jgi:hypothetical protein
MPRVETPKHRVQRTFAPLLFRTYFRPEQPLTPPPLPWLATFSPHVDGQLLGDDPHPVTEGSSVSGVALVKMKRPSGEPGRNGSRGFNLRSALDLPGGMYEEVLVSFVLYNFVTTTD